MTSLWYDVMFLSIVICPLKFCSAVYMNDMTIIIEPVDFINRLHFYDRMIQFCVILISGCSDYLR